jgi:hypothetical protein
MNNTKAREVGRKVRMARAVSRALDLAPTIEELQESGVTTLRGIAAALNERGIPTSHGKGQWQASQVRRLMTAFEVVERHRQVSGARQRLATAPPVTRMVFKCPTFPASC